MSTTLSVRPDLQTRAEDRVVGEIFLDVAAVTAIAVCALILHRDGLFGGPTYVELDTRLFYYPLAQWVGQQLQANVFPLWLPSIFTGYPLFADGELGLAYLPQVLLLYALPAPLAMVWLRVLHVFLAGLFTYLFLKTLRLDPLPALGGALVFAFGSFLSGQMHHENVVRSAIWLPAVLVCVERSAFRAPRAALGWWGLGALAFSQAALGLHPQPVLMIAVAVTGYGLFRAAVARRNALVGPAIVVGGIALAAAQWVPLVEWALVSSRRGGVGYEFASAFGLAPENLPEILFPYFFRLPDAASWWSLWQPWETELYVGIPTLALIVIGVFFSRRVELLYFLPLGALSLVIGMAEYAPINVHHLLWSIPGFSFLRAPGRFAYLVVFACACLAAFGLQALNQRRFRAAIALVGGVPSVALLAALLALLPAWRSWLLEDQARALGFLESRYLWTRSQFPIDPQVALAGALSSLDLANPKTAWSLVLLGFTGLGFVAWVGLGHRRMVVGQAVFVGLLAVDLLVFASDFHPRSALTSLVAPLPAGVTPGSRVLLHDATDLPAIAPDQLVANGVQTVQGYSSLPSQRHVELDVATSAQPNLLALWSAPLIAEPANPGDLREVDGVRFRARHPIASGLGGAAPSTFAIPPRVGAIRNIRVIGTLSYAFQAAQGQTVATVSLDDGREVFPLRAGVELAERAYDRPSLAGLVQHRRAPVALDFEEVTAEGEAYMAHLYEANLALPVPTPTRTITIAPSASGVLVDIHGIALIDTNGALSSLDFSSRAGLRRLTPELVLDSDALPRAYVLPRTQAFSLTRHPGRTATQLVASPDVDLHTMVLIEGDPNTPVEPSGALPAAAASEVVDLGPNGVRITATADTPSYLVLNDFYQRGWIAQVDGQAAPVLIANALFRAVPIEPGRHQVELRFEPLSVLVGAAISIVSVLGVLVLIGIGYAHSRRERERSARR